MAFSLRQRREISAREPLSISIRPLSDGEYHAVLIEEAHPHDIERYTSASQPSMAEALTLAEHEMHQLVERRVDALEAQDQDSEVIVARSTLPRAFGGF